MKELTATILDRYAGDDDKFGSRRSYFINSDAFTDIGRAGNTAADERVRRSEGTHRGVNGWQLEALEDGETFLQAEIAENLIEHVENIEHAGESDDSCTFGGHSPSASLLLISIPRSNTSPGRVHGASCESITSGYQRLD